MRRSLANVKSTRALAVLPLAVLGFGGCYGQRGDLAFAQQAACSVRVIVRLATEPDAALLADLERANAVELEPLSAITADLRVYALRAAGPDDECRDAIERLRRDARVRSVDIDARRELHD
jgi:hypothetical protein